MAMVRLLVSGMSGLDGDAMEGTRRFARRVPRQPGCVYFERYRVAGSLAAGAVERTENTAVMTIALQGAPPQVHLASGQETQRARVEPGAP